MTAPDKTVALVHAVLEKTKLSIDTTDTASLVTAIVARLVPDVPPPEIRAAFETEEQALVAWSRARRVFTFEIVRAIDCIKREKNTRWKN